MKKNGKNIYPDESHIHKCQRKGCENTVIQKPGSSYIPKYCQDCLKEVRKENAKKGRKERAKNLRKQETEKLEEVIAPTGEKLYLNDTEERDYYNLRKNAYLKDFALITAADTTLLNRLLTLEIECRRIEKKLSTKEADKWLQESLYKATEQIRRVQQDLGITRKARQNADTNKSPSDILRDLMDKFNDYRENNPDIFTWICSKCGEKHVLYRRNTEWEKKNEKTN